MTTVRVSAPIPLLPPSFRRRPESSRPSAGLVFVVNTIVEVFVADAERQSNVPPQNPNWIPPFGRMTVERVECQIYTKQLKSDKLDRAVIELQIQ